MQGIRVGMQGMGEKYGKSGWEREECRLWVGNAENQGGNEGNMGGNAENQGRNAGNMGRNAGNRTEIEKAR